MAGNTSFELETDQDNELGQIVVVQKVSYSFNYLEQRFLNFAQNLFFWFTKSCFRME